MYSLFKRWKLLLITEEYKQEIMKANKDMADRALRILACAENTMNKSLLLMKHKI